MKKFTYFQNEEGSFTVQYGKLDDADSIIIGYFQWQKEAKLSCSRLNEIIKNIVVNQRPLTKGFHSKINQITEKILKDAGQL